MDNIFKRLWDKFFPEPKKTDKELIQEEYEIVMNKILSSKTLSDLMDAQQLMITFLNHLARLGNPTWARGKEQFVKRHWHRKYQIWKKGINYGSSS